MISKVPLVNKRKEGEKKEKKDHDSRLRRKTFITHIFYSISLPLLIKHYFCESGLVMLRPT